MTLGIGILSWRGGDTLKILLKSYKNANLFSLCDEKIVFLPEQQDYETHIAQEYGLTVFGHKDNLGILAGFKALAQSMTADYILLLENDCCGHKKLNASKAGQFMPLKVFKNPYFLMLSIIIQMMMII